MSQCQPELAEPLVTELLPYSLSVSFRLIMPGHSARIVSLNDVTSAFTQHAISCTITKTQTVDRMLIREDKCKHKPHACFQLLLDKRTKKHEVRYSLPGRSYIHVLFPNIAVHVSLLLLTCHLPVNQTHQLQTAHQFCKARGFKYVLGFTTQLSHTVTVMEMYKIPLSFSTGTHIFHIVLNAVLLQVGRCLSLIEPLRGI